MEVFIPAAWLEAQVSGKRIGIGTISPETVPGFGYVPDWKSHKYDAEPFYYDPPPYVPTFEITKEADKLEMMRKLEHESN